MHAIETSLPANALWLAERLWCEPGAVLLLSADGSGPSYLSAWPSEVRAGLDPEPELLWGGPKASSDTRLSAPRWVGLLPYEAMRAAMERPRYSAPERREEPHHVLAQWWRYPAFVRVDGRVTVVGDDEDSARALLEKLEHPLPPVGKQGVIGDRCAMPQCLTNELAPALAAAVHEWPAQTLARLARGAQLSRRQWQESSVRHRQRIETALERILDGDIYEINLARRIELDVQGTTLELLARLTQKAPAPFAFAFESGGVVSTSPELCLNTTRDRRALTVPIKGTRPRGQAAASERYLEHDLEHDPKERAELSMVIDIERNDLGRVAAIGSVSALPPRVVRHSTVLHRQATVSAFIRPEVSREQLLRSFLPSGSVTGAPKIRAMETIAELEAERRGLYTGAFGVLRHDGTLSLAMAIRTLTVQHDIGHYFVGGGIVLRSNPDREVEETEWKALQLG